MRNLPHDSRIMCIMRPSFVFVIISSTFRDQMWTNTQPRSEKSFLMGGKKSEWINTCNTEINAIFEEKQGREGGFERGFSPGLETHHCSRVNAMINGRLRQQLTTRPSFSAFRPFSLWSAYRKGEFYLSLFYSLLLFIIFLFTLSFSVWFISLSPSLPRSYDKWIMIIF